jgi:hypothetical protein
MEKIRMITRSRIVEIFDDVCRASLMQLMIIIRQFITTNHFHERLQRLVCLFQFRDLIYDGPQYLVNIHSAVNSFWI